MANNRSSNSTFGLPDDSLRVVRQSASESLLFSDIMVEKSSALRNAMREFLQTKPYSLFAQEFTIFLNRLKLIENVNPNVSSSSSASESVLVNSTQDPVPVASTNTNRNRPEIVESGPNPLKPLMPDRQRTVYLPNPRNISIPVTPPVSTNTISKETKIPAAAVAHVIFHAPADQTPAPPKKRATKVATPTTRNNVRAIQPNSILNVKYLHKWRVTLKEIKSTSGASTVSIILSGVLVTKGNARVLKKRYNAGILKCRKSKDFIETDNGSYKLIGPVSGGMPSALINECKKSEGIPRAWRNLLKKIADNKKVKRSTAHANTSITRGGTSYKNAAAARSKLNNKRKCAGNDNKNVKQVKNDNIQGEPSTATFDKKFSGAISPSQYLKFKFHQKFVRTCNLMKNTAGISIKK